MTPNFDLTSFHHHDVPDSSQECQHHSKCQPHAPPTINFSNTSRGPTPKCYTFLDPNSDAKILQFFLQSNFKISSRRPTPKCYTFLETSHDPQLDPILDAKILHIFLQPFFCKQT